MASSGVRENVYLTITPTFVGVCGMLFLIILVEIFCQMLACMPYILYILNILFGQLSWMLDVTDVVVTFGLKPNQQVPTTL